MVNNEPLIPPPSIGESAQSKAIPNIKPPKKKGGSKLWLVVLACVVVGVGLGVFVYQQSIAPAPKPSTTPRPTIAPKPSLLPSPIPSPSVAPADVSQVTPSNNKISFPKAGEVRVYYSNYEGKASVLLDLSSASGSVGVQMAGTGSSVSMATLDTGFELPGAEQVTIGLFDGGDYDKPGYGWIPPKADNTCGGDGSAVHPDITPFINYATAEAEGEPLVSIQCWGDWGPSGDISKADFNDYVVIWSYTPPSAQSTTVPSSSPTASVSPSPTATATATPTPTPSTAGTVTTTPTPSPRAAMPEGETLPDAGVFEVTVGTISLGLIFLVLGLLGLLVL